MLIRQAPTSWSPRTLSNLSLPYDSEVGCAVRMINRWLPSAVARISQSTGIGPIRGCTNVLWSSCGTPDLVTLPHLPELLAAAEKPVDECLNVCVSTAARPRDTQVGDSDASLMLPLLGRIQGGKVWFREPLPRDAGLDAGAERAEIPHQQDRQPVSREHPLQA